MEEEKTETIDSEMLGEERVDVEGEKKVSDSGGLNTPASPATTEDPSGNVEEEDAEDAEEEINHSSSIFGCLSHPREPESSRLLQSLLRLKTKDSLNLLLKTLRERYLAVLQQRGTEKDVKEEGMSNAKVVCSYIESFNFLSAEQSVELSIGHDLIYFCCYSCFQFGNFSILTALLELIRYRFVK